MTESLMERFVETVNGFWLLNIFVKRFTLDVLQCSEYTFGSTISPLTARKIALIA